MVVLISKLRWILLLLLLPVLCHHNVKLEDIIIRVVAEILLNQFTMHGLLTLMDAIIDETKRTKDDQIP